MLLLPNVYICFPFGASVLNNLILWTGGSAVPNHVLWLAQIYFYAVFGSVCSAHMPLQGWIQPALQSKQTAKYFTSKKKKKFILCLVIIISHHHMVTTCDYWTMATSNVGSVLKLVIHNLFVFFVWKSSKVYQILLRRWKCHRKSSKKIMSCFT